MTDEQIKTLILTGEGYHTEFKQTLEKTLIEEVCAFANSSGGYILLGVADDGTVKGIDTSNRNRSKVQDILGKLEPKLKTTVEVKESLIVIHVPEGNEKPYGCSRGFFMRVGANSQKMTRNEILNFYKKEGRIRFGELINDKANFKKDFDSKAFKHFLKLSNISSNIKREILLQNLDCLTPDKQLTNLGVLFFAKDIDFIMNYARVDCILFRGTEKVKILDRKQYMGNIIENIESALAFVQRHTNLEYVITGKPRREEIPDYPEPAIREAIVNAVCHRDYFIKEVPVVVEVFANRVEVRNPGGLPKGFNPKNFGTQSFPRNLLIASMLHRANYIEQAGTGINRMKTAIKNHKKKLSMKIKYGADNLFYSVIFKKKEELIKTKKEISEKIVKSTDKSATQAPFGVNANEFRSIFGVNVNGFRSIFGVNILNAAWLIHKNPNISAQEIAEKLSVTKRSAENYLSKLKEAKHIKRIGSDKTGHWQVIKK
ncbi:MAG: helix-turn-helix domain-containing protein [Bdellovibrionales bacterium]|nr:helix-turn-helix domain-containing protein [Bdellovibrionales bacterium]